VYYTAKSFVQLPFQIVNASVFILIVYGMTGLRPDTNSLIHHLLVLILAYLIFTQVIIPSRALWLIECLDLEPCSDDRSIGGPHFHDRCLLCGFQFDVF